MVAVLAGVSLPVIDLGDMLLLSANLARHKKIPDVF
jgi:hypothetical protein